MKTIIAMLLLTLLAACQSTPRLEEDARYVRLATVVDVHEFTDLERKQAQSSRPTSGSTGVGVGVGMGSGSFGSFSGISVGIGHTIGSGRDIPPQIADGANRFTVQPLGSTERIEVMSFGHYQVGDCVKVLAGHPTEYPRFFELKPGEHCD
jgi:hypothetical protein